MVDINRIIWIVLFLIGVLGFSWTAMQGNAGSEMAWFILTSLWSAICAIGYTILHWFIAERNANKH